MMEPIGATWYYRINSSGEVAEISVLVMTESEWSARREANDPTWRPVRFGDLVVALKAIS